MKRKHHTILKGTAMLLATAQMTMPVLAATQAAWEVDAGKWRYKDKNGQYQKSTWLRDPSDNRLYHLDGEGVMDVGWKFLDGVWYFLTNEHTGYYGAALENTWAWIDGYCYYFGADGKMMAACTTADGFTVNADGQWTENGVPVYIAGRGYITKPDASTQKQNGSSSGRAPRSSGKTSNSKATASAKATENENYDYTIRYITNDGEILASYDGKAAKDAVLTPEPRTFSGYHKVSTEEKFFHLVADHSVFNVIYQSEADKESAGRTVPYAVTLEAEDGTILGGYAASGKPGDVCKLEEEYLARNLPDYQVKDGAITEWKLSADTSNRFMVVLQKHQDGESDKRKETLKADSTEQKGTLSYKIQAVGPRNEVLGESEHTGNLKDTVKLEFGDFNGYERLNGQPSEDTLTEDGQVFHVFYQTTEQEERIIGREESGTKSPYTIYYVNTDGDILKKIEEIGEAGQEIAIPFETFNGYEEAANQTHTAILKAGVSAFTILYRTASESAQALNYTIRYADMSGTVLYEETGVGLRGDAIDIPVKTFSGMREIENQSHAKTLLNDNSILFIKYESIREEEPEEEPEEELEDTADEAENTEETFQMKNAVAKQTIADAAKQLLTNDDESGIGIEGEEADKLSYNIQFETKDGETVGLATGKAPEGTLIEIPDLELSGYEKTELPADFLLEEDGQTVTVICEDVSENDIALLSDPNGEELATVSEADEEDLTDGVLKAETRYNYMIRYCDRDTGELLESQLGSAYAGMELNALKAPAGYVLADHDPYVIVASDNPSDNTFTVWCINEAYVKPAGYVDYTIDCVDAAGNIIKTFTGSAKAGMMLRPHYEIYGYDMDTKKEYVFTLTETENHFEVLYIPYQIYTYEFRAIDIETGDVLFTKTMEGRGGKLADVTLTEDDFVWEDYELLSEIPAQVRISSNKSNNFYNLYMQKKQEQVDIEDLRPYVVHFVSYQDKTKRIFDDKVGIGVVGSQIRASYLMKINNSDGTYEAIASADTMTFTIDGQQEVNEFYVYFYKTADFSAEKTKVNYSIRLEADDTGSVLGVMTGSAYPGTKIYLRNTFREYAFREDTDNYFVVTDDTDQNYATVILYRISGSNPKRNEHTGKYDGAEWLITFVDESGNLLLPWRTGYTRKGDVFYVDYPDTIEGADGSVYRAVSASPYIEYQDGTVYRQYQIRYRKGNESENLLAKWEKEAQASFDEIKRTVPYSYTIVYREEDSWNDVGIYTGVATKGDTVNIQNIKIPGYILPDDTDNSFVLDEDQKQVVFYVEPDNNDQSMKKYKREYLIRFTDGNGISLLPPVAGDMAYETAEAHGYMTLHYPNTFRDQAGNIWTADENSPKQLTTWMLSTNEFEITYHKTFENGFENFYADTAEDARRILTEMAVFTIDAAKHSYYVIGRDYNATKTEVSTIVSQYDIANYTTELVDQFEKDGVTYYITRVSFNRVWHEETCTHNMEVTKTVKASCEVTGMVVKTCTKCGHTETTYEQALGHEDDNHDGMCDRCGARMDLNIGDEITVTWNPGESGLPAMNLNFICIDTDYQGTGKKMLLCEDGFNLSEYGGYSQSGHASYQSSDLRTFLEDMFMDGLSNRRVLADAGLRNVGLLTKAEYDKYKAQAENAYLFPDGLTILQEDRGEDTDGLVQMSDGSRVTPEEANTKTVRPIIFMDAGGATEGVVSGHWKVGDIQSRTIDGETYLFRCVNDNYKDNSNLDKTMALFLCDTVMPSYTGLGYNTDDSKRDTRFFGKNNNYRYSEIHKYLSGVKTGTGNLVTMDIGVANEYSGSTASGSFEKLDARDLTKYKRDRAQYLEAKLYIPSVEEALDLKDYLWKFDRSETDNVAAAYDGHYATSYWLRTPVYGTTDMIYTVNLLNGTIEPHRTSEEFAIPDTRTSMEYSADNGNTWTDCTDGQTLVSAADYYLVREKSVGTEKTPVLSGGMYVLTETTASMEYSTDGGTTWKQCSDGQTAVGVSANCLLRNKSGSTIIKTDAATNVLTVTDTDMEWSGDDGQTWHTCTNGLTVVPSIGTYILRHTSNPDGVTTQESVVRYPLSGTQAGYEYSNHNADWTACSAGTTYVDAAGTYTVRRMQAGTDRMAVKQACSVGIRPMYSVYQDQ